MWPQTAEQAESQLHRLRPPGLSYSLLVGLPFVPNALMNVSVEKILRTMRSARIKPLSTSLPTTNSELATDSLLFRHNSMISDIVDHSQLQSVVFVKPQ